MLGSLAQPQAQDNPQATSGSWRPTIVAQHGMVAAGHPLAAEAGMRILKAGGNAIDAAIATWAVQGEVEPGMTGLGADMFILYYNAKTRRGEVHQRHRASRRRPRRSTSTRSKGGIPDEGPLSSSVPGAVGGAAYAVKTYGTRPLTEVLAPAIEIADGGFPVTEALADGDQERAGQAREVPLVDEALLQGRQAARDGRHHPQPGSGAHAARDRGAGRRAVLPRRHREEHGRVPEGERRHHLAKPISPSYQPFEDAPVHVNYRGAEVYECPPNSQGFVMLEALNILEGYDLKAMGRNSAPYLHAVTEALKLSFADRNAYVGDPKFVPDIPMKELLSKEYAAARRTQIDPNRAIVGEPAPGDPRAHEGDDRRPAQAYASPLPPPTEVEAVRSRTRS